MPTQLRKFLAIKAALKVCIAITLLKNIYIVKDLLKFLATWTKKIAKRLKCTKITVKNSNLTEKVF